MIGTSLPLSAQSISKAEERLGMVWPPSYRALLLEHGVGVLCGRFHLHDPTDLDPNGDWALHARFMKRQGSRWHKEGAWNAISTGTWPLLTVFADDGRGRLAWDRGQRDDCGECPIWYMDHTGEVATLVGQTLHEVVARLTHGELPGIGKLPATYSTTGHAPSGFIPALERPTSSSR